MSSRKPLRHGVFAVAAALVLLGAACADDDDTTPPAATPQDAPSAVGVTLQEWSVIPDASAAVAGEVTFEVSNAGTVEHELMVFRTDLGLTDLPTLDDGSLDADGEGLEVLHAHDGAAHMGDDHDIFEVGESGELSFEMEAGSYLLVCNLVTGDEDEDVHFALGMRIPFIVE